MNKKMSDICIRLARCFWTENKDVIKKEIDRAIEQSGTSIPPEELYFAVGFRAGCQSVYDMEENDEGHSNK